MADKYRLVSGTHYRRGSGDSENYKFTPGDILELSEQEQASFGDKFELTTGGNLSEGGSLKEFEANRAKAARPAKAAKAAKVKEPAAAAPGLAEAFGIDEKLADLLSDAGFESRADVDDASDDELLAISGIGKATLKKLR